MFALPLLAGRRRRCGAGAGQWFAEIVATFGLVGVILAGVRVPRRSDSVARRALHHRRLLVHRLDLVRQPGRGDRPRADGDVLRHPAGRRAGLRGGGARRGGARGRGASAGSWGRRQEPPKEAAQTAMELASPRRRRRQAGERAARVLAEGSTGTAPVRGVRTSVADWLDLAREETRKRDTTRSAHRRLCGLCGQAPHCRLLSPDGLDGARQGGA